MTSKLQLESIEIDNIDTEKNYQFCEIFETMEIEAIFINENPERNNEYFQNWNDKLL